MQKLLVAAALSLGLASPALAYGLRDAGPSSHAAELQRMTGSQAYPESRGGHVREARPVQTGSEALPQPTRGVAHNGVDMMIGGSARHPVLTPDMLSHPPTALSQDQVLTQGFDRTGPRPASVAATTNADIDG